MKYSVRTYRYYRQDPCVSDFLKIIRYFGINFGMFLVNRIHANKERILEGELRCKALHKYLEAIQAPMSVFLSEDASGIVKKVVFDSHTNQMIGIVLPFDLNTGMPCAWTFMAETAEKMKEYLEKPQSTLVYIIAAQPLKENAAPFILQIYGTDNKFDADSVSKRWIFTEKQLKK